MTDHEALQERFQTWNTCPECGQEWPSANPTPGVVHRTALCLTCVEKLGARAAAAASLNDPEQTVTVDVFKAQPAGDASVKSLVLRAFEPIPDGHLTSEFDSLPAWYAAMRCRYEEQGQRIADALLQHLPGGTVDQVLRALLQYRASLFAVPFTEREPEVVTYPTTTDPDLVGTGSAPTNDCDQVVQVARQPVASVPTPGPWRVGGMGSVVADSPIGIPWTDDENRRAYGGYLVCESVTAPNARLIVEAVNLGHEFITWYEEAGSNFYANDEGLHVFYRQACEATGSPARWGWDDARNRIIPLAIDDGGAS